MSCYPRAGSPDGVDAEALGAGGACYQQWDWPVIVHRGQVRLSRSREVSALAIPVALGTEVTQIFTQRRAPRRCWPIPMPLSTRSCSPASGTE